MYANTVEERLYLDWDWFKSELEDISDTSPTVSMGLAVLKRVAILGTDTSLSKQLQVVQLPHSKISKDIYETLYSFVHHTLHPYLEFCSNDSGETSVLNEIEAKSGKISNLFHDLLTLYCQVFLLQRRNWLN